MSLTERHLVNAIVGLCKNTRTWPHHLHDLGYSVHSVEQSFTNSKGVVVTPDIIVSSEQRDHALVIECKSGGYVKANQIDKYPDVTDRDVSVKALVPSSDPSNFRADMTVFCLGDKFASLHVDLDSTGWTHPVIALSPGVNIELKMNAIRETDTDTLFRQGINLNAVHKVPTHFVPLMSSHATDYEIAAEIMPQIVARLRLGKPQFTVLDLCTLVFREIWDVLDPSEQDKMGQRFRIILGLAAKTDLRGILKRTGDGKLDQAWEIAGPSDTRYDLIFYRGLRARTRNLLERLRKGGSKADKHYTQLTPEDVMKELERRGLREGNDPQD